jgi:hypothetical protein
MARKNYYRVTTGLYVVEFGIKAKTYTDRCLNDMAKENRYYPDRVFDVEIIGKDGLWLYAQLARVELVRKKDTGLA